MKKSIWIILLVSLLTSCSRSDIISTSQHQTADVSTVGQTSIGHCLDPQNNFAFPAGDASDLPAPKKPDVVLPADPWRMVSALPDPGFDDFFQKVNSFVIRSNGDHEELWVVSKGHSGVRILNLETLEWKRIEDGNDFLENAFLFVDKEGIVWAAKSGGESTSLLQYFDDNAGRFINAIDHNDLLHGNVNNKAITNIEVDSHGTFWMTIINNDLTLDPHLYLLYSYIPSTASAEKRELGIDFDDALAIGKNDIIYLVDAEGGIVIGYDSLKGISTTYEIQSKIDSGYSFPLYYDLQDRLWVGSLGWFDFQDKSYPRWYEIVRPPILLTYIDSAGLWRWVDPFFTAETVDGLLWFFSANGTGWVNPTTGEWCIFTTYTSEIVEDRQNDLWILVNNSVYRK